jgi:hypothetical protein
MYKPKAVVKYACLTNNVMRLYPCRVGSTLGSCCRILLVVMKMFVRYYINCYDSMLL